MALTGTEIVGVVAGVIFGAAILLALICCVCSHYPSMKTGFFSFFGSQPQKTRQKRIPSFSSENFPARHHQYPHHQSNVKVGPLGAIMVLPQSDYEMKLKYFSQSQQQQPQQQQQSFADHDQKVDAKIITISGSRTNHHQAKEGRHDNDDDTRLQPESEQILNKTKLATPQLEGRSRPELILGLLGHPPAEISVLRKEQEILKIEPEERKKPQENKEPITIEEKLESFQPMENHPVIMTKCDQMDPNVRDDDGMAHENDEMDQMAMESEKNFEEFLLAELQDDSIEPAVTKNFENLKNSDESHDDCVILGVGATPHRHAGYCIVPGKNLCEFYTADPRLLPWRLYNVTKQVGVGGDGGAAGGGGNPSDFEMKNLMFALLNWEDLIRSAASLRVYTDNMAEVEEGMGSRQGINVRAFLRHLTKCQNVTVMNNSNTMGENNRELHQSSSMVNEDHKNVYEKYIQPADLLARKKLLQFHNHVRQHFPQVREIKDGFYVGKVEGQITKWTQNKCECSFQLRISHSLRDTVQKRTTLARCVKAFPNT